MKKPVLLLLALLAGVALCGCVGEKDLIDVSSAASAMFLG